MEEMSAEEISSILESELSSEEKSSILGSYNWPKDNKLTTSSPMELKKKVDEDIEAKIKKDDGKLNEDGKSKRNDESLLHPLSQQKKVDEDIEAKIKKDDGKLNDDGKSKWNDESLLHPSSQQKKVDEDIEAKIKKDDGKLNDDGKSKRNDESLLHSLSQQTKAKAKEIVDPLTDAEIALILYSELTSEEKSSLLASNLPVDQIKICSTPSRVEIEEKVQHSEMKPKEDNDNLPSDGTSKGTNESLSQANAKVALDLKLRLPNEKPLSLACNKNEEDMTLSKVKTSTTSLGVELEEKNQHMRTEENGSVNRIVKASTLRAQQGPMDDCHLLLELEEHTVFIVREIEEPQNSSEGKDVETIYKEEAVCKKCCKYLVDKENVLKAKCKCKLALIHEHCAIQWAEEKGRICLSCGEQIENIQVTLIMDTSTSSPQQNNIAEELETPTSVSKNW